MKNAAFMTALFTGGLFACAWASAQTAPASPWSVRLGVAHIGFNPKAEVFLGGAPVPGADVELKNNTTLTLEIGYSISPQLTGRLLLGVPPTTTFTGSGTITGTGTLGKAKYGPAVLSLTHGLGQWGPIKPYAGGGIAYNIIFKSEDAFISNLDIKNSFGSVLQAGFDVPLRAGWSVGLDVKKIFLKTTGTGTVPAFGGAPASLKLKLDPLVTSIVVGRQF